MLKHYDQTSQLVFIEGREQWNDEYTTNFDAGDFAIGDDQDPIAAIVDTEHQTLVNVLTVADRKRYGPIYTIKHNRRWPLRHAACGRGDW